MKKDFEILDEFGQIVITQILDRHHKGFKNEIFEGFRNPNNKKYNVLFSKLSNSEKELMIKYLIQNSSSQLFDFLSIFEENEQFKIVYEEGGKQVNLVEVSEMLKAEPLGEDGWVARFSKELKADDIP